MLLLRGSHRRPRRRWPRRAWPAPGAPRRGSTRAPGAASSNGTGRGQPPARRRRARWVGRRRRRGRGTGRGAGPSRNRSLRLRARRSGSSRSGWGGSARRSPAFDAGGSLCVREAHETGRAMEGGEPREAMFGSWDLILKRNIYTQGTSDSLAGAKSLWGYNPC